jgi:hypothetical protein
MKLNLKYYNQRKDVIDDEWKPKACLIVCVKMILDFLDNKEIPIDDLIKEGICIGAWDGKYWKHDGVVRILRNHGIMAYPQEFKSVFVDIKNSEMTQSKYADILFDKGLKKIVSSIDNECPVIVSIRLFFKKENTHHGVVIIGYEKNNDGSLKGFYYHDPEMNEVEEGKDLFVLIDDFKTGWKKLSIFVEK